ncbi:MAG: alpha/beta fold hydrolase [Granulosicoccus sp.]
MNPTLRCYTLVMCTTLLACCSSNDETVSDSTEIAWNTCTDNSQLQCAELTVPMTYDGLSTETITLGLNRRPASGDNKRGVLLFNPGGPGGSGMQVLDLLVQLGTIPDVILSDYDLIGFDPRGIGQSTAVDCQEFGINEQLSYIVDRADIDEFLTTVTTIASQCSDKHGSYLQHLGSINVVRDMDEIRRALNEDKLNFIGYSYGTRLAALYLQTYPENSGYMVLDGSMHPSSENIALIEGSIPAMVRNLESLLSQCTRITPGCEVNALLNRLENRIEFLNQQGETEELLLVGELVLLGARDPVLGDFLVAPLINYLQNFNTSGLQDFVALFDALLGQGEEQDDDNITARTAVLCADDATRPTAELLEQKLTDFNLLSDLFAEAYIGFAGSCAGWPEALEPLATIQTQTAPASLVIGGTTDAQTPLFWSEVMANAIGGHYLESQHPGHTTVFTDQSDCVNDLVVKFLVNGELPQVASCPAN